MPRARSWSCAVVAVDDRGRIAVGGLLREMGWPPATALAVCVQAGLVVVTADPGGADAVSPQGHLRLLARVRRRCGITNGCRVLAVADVDNRRLIIHPPTSLDALLADCYADILDRRAA